MICNCVFRLAETCNTWATSLTSILNTCNCNIVTPISAYETQSNAATRLKIQCYTHV